MAPAACLQLRVRLHHVGNAGDLVFPFALWWLGLQVQCPQWDMLNCISNVTCKLELDCAHPVKGCENKLLKLLFPYSWI